MNTPIAQPRVDESAFVGEGAVIWGDVEVGADCAIWYNAVIRGDQAPIRIGERSNVQDCAVVHVSDGYPVTIGSGVTVGHTAIVHGCTIGDDTLIGMGATVMNGAVIGKRCTIGAGSLVTQGMQIPDDSVAFGNPCKIRRAAEAADVEAARRNAEHYVELGRMHKRAAESE